MSLMFFRKCTENHMIKAVLAKSTDGKVSDSEVEHQARRCNAYKLYTDFQKKAFNIRVSLTIVVNDVEKKLSDIPADKETILRGKIQVAKKIMNDPDCMLTDHDYCALNASDPSTKFCEDSNKLTCLVKEYVAVSKLAAAEYKLSEDNQHSCCI